MLTFEQMVTRLLIALALGALIGLEREAVGKDAGIRTAMLVTAGAAVFAMISILMPYIAQVPPEEIKNTLPDRIISNIVVGVGFLGGGIIFKTTDHVRGLTTAAVIWVAAAIGTLVGIGLIPFATVTAILTTSMLYILRKVHLYEHIRPGHKIHENENE